MVELRLDHFLLTSIFRRWSYAIIEKEIILKNRINRKQKNDLLDL